jgi:hypothetical protein
MIVFTPSSMGEVGDTAKNVYFEPCSWVPRSVADESLVSMEKLKHDLVTARERARMHSYLAREASAELTWIKFLHERLTDQASFATAINSER